MENSGPLVPFGIAVVIIVGLFIAIPIIRRKTDILNAWNTLLLGVVIFCGLGSIEVRYVPTLAWEQLHWFQPQPKEVQWYMLATSVFIITLLAAYYLNTPAKRFAQKRLQKWPEATPALTLFVIGVCLVLIVMSIVFERVTFLGPLSFNLATIGVPASCVFSFALWYRNRINLAWLLLFLGVFLSAILYAMVVSGGRRLLLSLFLGPVLYMYWTQVRYWRPSRALAVMAAAGAMILMVSVIYSSFRWYNLATKEKRTVGGLVQKLLEKSAKGELYSVFLQNQLSYLAQNNGHFALLTERYVSQGDLTPIPLNTLRFLAAYPIPHNIWANKPEVIGLTITRDVAKVPTNWGLGVAGQGAFEGGIPALMLYAVLLAFGIRIFDEPMRLQPSNPFLIYMHASALPHIASIPRGDMGIMTKEAAQSVLFAVLLGIACRIIFGTERLRRPLPTAQVPMQRRLQRSYR
jgi:hypothetical protein